MNKKLKFKNIKLRLLNNTLIDIRQKTLNIEHTDVTLLPSLSLDENLSEITQYMELLILRIIEEA
jgi:hypothetical protein